MMHRRAWPPRYAIVTLSASWLGFAHVGCDEDRILMGTSFFLCFHLAWCSYVSTVISCPSIYIKKHRRGDVLCYVCLQVPIVLHSWFKQSNLCLYDLKIMHAWRWELRLALRLSLFCMDGSMMKNFWFAVGK